MNKLQLEAKIEYYIGKVNEDNTNLHNVQTLELLAKQYKRITGEPYKRKSMEETQMIYIPEQYEK